MKQYYFCVAFPANVTPFKTGTAFPAERQFLPGFSEISPQIPESLTIPDLFERLLSQKTETALFIEVRKTGADRSVPVNGGTVPKGFAWVLGNAYGLLIIQGVLGQLELGLARHQFSFCLYPLFPAVWNCVKLPEGQGIHL